MSKDDTEIGTDLKNLGEKHTVNVILIVRSIYFSECNIEIEIKKSYRILKYEYDFDI